MRARKSRTSNDGADQRWPITLVSSTSTSDGVEIGLDHRVDDRVELLLRRLPRLEQVVVDVDHVDGRDRSVGVGVRREQRPPCAREQVHRLLEELDAAHLRHAVVGEQHRDPRAAQLQLAQDLHRLGARGRAYDSVVLSVLTPQVAGHRSRHRRVVVDGQQYGPVRGLGLVAAGWRGGVLGHGCE